MAGSVKVQQIKRLFYSIIAIRALITYIMANRNDGAVSGHLRTL